MSQPPFKSPRRRIKKADSEANVHFAVARHLKLYHPDVEFITDFAAGIKLTPAQASMNSLLRSGKDWPDLTLFCGHTVSPVMVLELKKDRWEVFRKTDGKMVSDPHILGQYRRLKWFASIGIPSSWGLGYAHSLAVIHKWAGDCEDKSSPF